MPEMGPRDSCALRCTGVQYAPSARAIQLSVRHHILLRRSKHAHQAFLAARKPALNPIFALSMIEAQLTWLLCGERDDSIPIAVCSSPYLSASLERLRGPGCRPRARR